MRQMLLSSHLQKAKEPRTCVKSIRTSERADGASTKVRTVSVRNGRLSGRTPKRSGEEEEELKEPSHSPAGAPPSLTIPENAAIGKSLYSHLSVARIRTGRATLVSRLLPTTMHP